MNKERVHVPQIPQYRSGYKTTTLHKQELVEKQYQSSNNVNFQFHVVDFSY